MKIHELDTPCVLIDLDKVETNLRRWQEHCDRYGLDNRPHIKTHKLTEMAHRQVELGAVGIACQKLGEAEVMAASGIKDILIPYNIVGPAKLPRIARLAQGCTLRLCCDSTEVARPIAETMTGAGIELGLLVECDVGGKRCGVQSPEAALALAQELDGMDGVRFDGLMTYPPRGGQPAAQAFLSEAKALCEAGGLAVPMISSGGSPDMWTAQTVKVASEHRAGTYIYYDRMQVAAGAADFDDCALRVMATVVSRPTGDRVIIDAGSKALSSDLGGQTGHGRIDGYAEAAIYALSEEHGHCDFGPATGRPKVGEHVRIIPNHACVVSNLFDRVHGIRGDEVETTFEVAARGLVQ